MLDYEVIIMGRNYTSLLGMIRAVGELNCKISVIRTNVNFDKKKFYKKYTDNVEAKSKYVKKYYYINQDEKELMNILLSKGKENHKVILIPTDDFTASIIDLNQDRFNDNYLMPNIKHQKGKVVELMDKEKQKTIAKNNNLNITKTWLIKKENGKYIIPSNIVFPVFTKPLVSFQGNKTFMKKCCSNKELEELLAMISSKTNCDILAEEYISIEKEYAVLGYCYNGKVVIPGIIEMIKSGNGSHKGVTMIGKVESIDNNLELKNKLEKFIISTGFNGLFDIDLYESNGKMYFNELNLRFGASGYAITAAGMNLPKEYIERLLDIDNNNYHNPLTKSYYINEKVCLDDYINKFMNYKEYKEMINMDGIKFIQSSEDPKPYRSFKTKEMIVRIKKAIKK